MKSPTTILKIASVFMALAVVFGAFGAHAVKDMLTPERFDVYRTSVQYHFYHGIGLLIVGVIAFNITNQWIAWSAYSFIAGILIFSGSLYLLTLLDIGWLGAITPIGGIAFILGWIFLFISLTK